jgi:hypothetical protein
VRPKKSYFPCKLPQNRESGLAADLKLRRERASQSALFGRKTGLPSRQVYFRSGLVKINGAPGGGENRVDHELCLGRALAAQ